MRDILRRLHARHRPWHPGDWRTFVAGRSPCGV